MVLERELNEMSKEFENENKDELLDICTLFSLMNRIPKEELKDNIKITKGPNSSIRIQIALPC